MTKRAAWVCTKTPIDMETLDKAIRAAVQARFGGHVKVARPPTASAPSWLVEAPDPHEDLYGSTEITASDCTVTFESDRSTWSGYLEVYLRDALAVALSGQCGKGPDIETDPNPNKYPTFEAYLRRWDSQFATKEYLESLPPYLR